MSTTNRRDGSARPGGLVRIDQDAVATDLPVELWLAGMDRRPSVLPRWPWADSLALVMAEAAGDGVEIYLVVEQAAVERLLRTMLGTERLFFHVPKGMLMRSIPGVTEDTWASSWSRLPRPRGRGSPAFY